VSWRKWRRFMERNFGGVRKGPPGKGGPMFQQAVIDLG